ncbi:MAG: 4Fe-4S ferredoxin, partial [Desulfobacterales bacterium]
MTSYIEKIKEVSARLLKEGKVDMVIGFRQGTVPMMNEPFVARTQQDVQNLVWDSNCGINLTNYLTDRKEKIGIIAKGCDSRNIVTHIIENKIKREQLVIIGVPCKGMIDKRKISAMFEGEIREVNEEGNNIIVKGDDIDKVLNKNDFLQQNCRLCSHRNPVEYDELIAELVEEQSDLDRYADVRDIESMSPDGKWDFFENLLSP